MKEPFALLQKLLTFFQQKNWYISDINVRTFNETSTEQPGPDLRIAKILQLHLPSKFEELPKHCNKEANKLGQYLYKNRPNLKSLEQY